jgi:hypothetical protein
MALVRRRRPHAQLFVPLNAKIADITHADTLKHTLTLANGAGTGAIAGETRKIIAVHLSAWRMGGTGFFETYPNEGAQFQTILWDTSWGYQAIANGTQRIQYNLSVANDDWDVYCFGYVVEP